MATRKIVPRADNEGGLGTALKRWASAFINALTADVATIGALSGIVKAAAGVLSATALGAANLKFFMNAAGDAPEWKTGIKIGYIQRDTSLADGNVSYTGIGFKPSHIIFCGMGPTANEINPFGLDNGTDHYGFHYDQAKWNIHVSYSILLYQTTAIYALASVLSFDADGFTLAWLKNGAKTGTGTILYIAFR